MSYSFDYSRIELTIGSGHRTIGSEKMTARDIYSCVNFVRELGLNLEHGSDISFLSNAADFESNISSWPDCQIEWALGSSLAVLVCRNGIWRFSCELRDDVALSAIKLIKK